MVVWRNALVSAKKNAFLIYSFAKLIHQLAQRSILIGVALFLILSCTPAEKQCSADRDCVSAQCCHAADAVNKDYAPDCRGILCTQVCQPGTIDCNQGEIKCIKNECAVVLNE